MREEKKGMTKAKKAAIIKRIKGGETRASISADTGFSKQYLRLLWKNYQLVGQAALQSGKHRSSDKTKTRQRTLSPAEKKKIRTLLEKRERPAPLETIARLMNAEFGFTPLRRTIIQLTAEWDIPIAPGRPQAGMNPTPRDAFDEISKKERALREELNRKLASQDKAEWQLLGMPRGNRREGPGAQWRKRNYDPGQRSYICLEFWTAGTLLNPETRQLLKKKIHFYGKHLGVEVLSYVIMDSHCFLLVTLPAREKWLEKLRDPEKLIQRAKGLYQPSRLQEMTEQLEKARNPQKVLDYYLRDFCDLSTFVKMIKESVSRGHNLFQNTAGSLWMDRYRSLELTHRQDLVDCLIRLNRWPVTRGLLTAEDLPTYPWSSFGDLMGSSKRAITGTCRVLGIAPEKWQKPYPFDQKKGRKRTARNWFKAQILSPDQPG